MTGSEPIRTVDRAVSPLRTGWALGLLVACLQFPVTAQAAPSCDSTWPHALNVHGDDGQIDHKGQAWDLDTNSDGDGLFGVRAGKVNSSGDCHDTNDNLLPTCVGDGPAVSLGAPDFRDFDDNNPPDLTVASDTTFDSAATTLREFGTLTITNGATLTIDGAQIVNIEDDLVIDQGATLRVEGVADGQLATFYAGKKFSLNDGLVDIVSAGTLEVLTGDFGADNGSDLNCGPILTPGPAGKRTCGDTDGALFVHSGSGINLDNSIARGVFYGDGNEGRLQNQSGSGYDTLLQGAWTSGQVNVQSGADIVAGAVPQQSLCNSGGFHYAVVAAASGLTCEPLEVTIVAHTEDDSPVPPADGTTIEITANADKNNVDLSWDGGGATTSHTFDGNDDRVTLSLEVDKNSTVNIDVSEQLGPASEKSPDEDPDIVFTGDVLRFSTTIANQIAGKPSNVAPDAQSLALEAVSCSGSGSLFSGDREVQWAMECIDPSDGGTASVCPNRMVEINTEPLSSGLPDTPRIPANTAGNVTTYQSRTEDFDDSQVDFVFRYPDAGRIRLHARACTANNKTVDNCQSNKLITGVSNIFTVRPFGFFVDFDPDGDGTFDDRTANAACGGQVSCSADASGDVFAVAAEPFDSEVSAVVWEAADDTDSVEGLPDSNEALADNATTPSFGRESSPETVDLSRVLVAPGSGASGTLTGGTGVSGFVDGRREVTGLEWDEVGIIDLRAELADGSYFGAGDVTGRASDVGRFIPARLNATGNTPAFAPFCSPFTYLDQYFGYTTEPAVTVTAYNADGAVTQNYGEGFWKLPVPAAFPNRSYADAATASATFDQDLSATSISWADSGDDDLDGADTATIADERLRYERNGLEAPFDAAVNLTIPAADLTDADGVCTAASDSCNTGDGDTGSDVVFDGDSTTAGQQPIGGTELRFGRLVVEEAFGPETAPLEQRWSTQYWTGSTWSVNADDSCTALVLADEVRLDPDADDTNGNDVAGNQTVDLSSGSGTTVIVDDAAGVVAGEISLMAGEANVRFAAPGSGNQGWIDVRAALASDFPHLLGDFDGDGSFDDEPGARVTFGVFAGESDWIYLREVFPSP